MINKYINPITDKKIPIIARYFLAQFDFKPIIPKSIPILVKSKHPNSNSHFPNIIARIKLMIPKPLDINDHKQIFMLLCYII